MAKARPMWGVAIKVARRATGLTQAQLAVRLGRSADAVMRWELSRSRPPSRQRRALLREIGALNPAAAAALQTAFLSSTLSRRGNDVSPAPPAPPAPVIDVGREVERAVFELADELDVTARRARGALIRLSRRLNEVNVGWEQAQRRLEAWVQADASSAES